MVEKDEEDSPRAGRQEMSHIEQRQICERFGSQFLRAADRQTVGISANLSALPLNGLRHPPEGTATGWFIWAGEYSEAPDFFQPMHVYHLVDVCPSVLPYLGLAPGWRFLLAPGQVDVGYDATLLEI
jgi:hypothetical protein